MENTAEVSDSKVNAMESTLKKALERLNHQQNVGIFRQKESAECKEPVLFYEKWIPEILGLQKKQIKIECAQCTGLPLGPDGEQCGQGQFPFGMGQAVHIEAA